MKKTTRVLSVLMSLTLLLGLLPAAAVENAPAPLAATHDIANGSLNITTNGTYTVTGATNANNITVAQNVSATIILSGVTIDVSGRKGTPAINLSTAGACTITLDTNKTNILKAGEDNPGIYVPENNRVTFNGTGTLDVTGGASWPGIGRTGNGNILIQSGNITAYGGWSAAGIGGSYGFNGGTITITGGNVTACVGGESLAGIGNGRGNTGNANITISSGNVTVRGSIGGDGTGAKFSTGTNGNAVIVTDYITDQSGKANWKGIIVEGDNGQMYGDVTLTDNATIPSDKIVTIPENSTLTIPSGKTLTNHGTIINYGEIIGTVAGNPPHIPQSVPYIDEGGGSMVARCLNAFDLPIWREGWYVVDRTGTIDSRIPVNGNVHLILKDDCTLTAVSGIAVNKFHSLTVYSQSGRTGAVIADNPAGDWRTGGGAAIGGSRGIPAGDVTINGGRITATASTLGGACIGMGGWDGAAGSVTINDGYVKLICDVGGEGAFGDSGTRQINGGVVVYESNNNVEDLMGDVLMENCIVVREESGQVYGNAVLKDDLEIPSGKTLTVPADGSLTIPSGVTLTSSGTLTVGGTIVNNGTVRVKVALDATGGAVEPSSAYIAFGEQAERDLPTPTYDGHTFDGWYTADGIPAEDWTVPIITAGQTLYAHWTEHKSQVAVTFSSEAPVYGDTMTITATVAPDNSNRLRTVAQNTVTFSLDNETLGTAEVVDNQARLTVTLNEEKWIPGEKTITAQFGGSAAMTGSIGTGTFEVQKITPQVTPPSGKTGLTYSGSPQPLIDAGSTTGGTLQYSIDNSAWNTHIPAATDANAYTVYYKVVGDAYYNGVAAQSVNVTIAPKPITCTVRIFGTATMDETLAAEYSPSTETVRFQWYRDNAAIEGAANQTYRLTAADVGTAITVTLTGTGNYTGTVTSDPTATVEKATPAVTQWPTATPITYGQSLSHSNLTGGQASVAGTFTWVNGDAQPAVADSGQTEYDVIFTPSKDGYHSVPEGKAALTVEKATLIPSSAAVSKTYDSTTDATGTVSLEGAVNGEKPTASGTFAFIDANAGTGKRVNVTNIVLTNGWDANYQLSSTSAETTADIAQKSISGATITLGDSLIYTGQAQTQTVSKVEIDGLNTTYTVSNDTGTDAGDYLLTVTGTGNFTDIQTKAFTIYQATNYITDLECANITYGGTPTPTAAAAFGNEFTYTYSRDRNGEYTTWNTTNGVGIWYVKASVEGTLNYAGVESEAVSFQVTAQQEATPAIGINYLNERLTGFDANAAYTIDSNVVTPENGVLAVEDYIGQAISIVRTARNANYADSEPYSLTVKPRPAPPAGALTLTKTADSITVTNVNAAWEYSVDGAAWNEGAFTGLVAGQTYTVRFRLKATHDDFCSEAKTQGVTTVNADGSTTLKPGESVEIGTAPKTTVIHDGETVTITTDGTATTVTPAGEVEVDAGGNVTVPGGSTVQTGEDGTPITVGDQGGTVDPATGEVTVPAGGSVTIPDGKGGTTEITVPTGSGSQTVTPTEDGVKVPEGSTITTSGGTATITEGAGTVAPDGSITFPEGGKVTITDSEGNTTEFTVGPGETINPADPPHIHSWAAAWSTSDTHHWHTCTAKGCDVTDDRGKDGYGEHTRTWVSTGEAQHWETCATCGWESVKESHTWDNGVVTAEATYDTDGVMTYTCTTCGREKTETIPMLSHHFSPDWTADADFHWHICTDEGCAETSDKAYHVYTDAQDATCNICGHERTVTPPSPTVYTVTFDTQCDMEVASQSVTQGERATKPADPAWRGYTFAGWYKEAECTTAWSFETDVVTADITLYAKWTVLPKGSSSIGGSKPSVSGGEGGSVTASRDGTVTITPDEGHQIAKITVNGEKVSIPADGKLTGLKRTDEVVVTFEPIPAPITPASERFADVKAGAWYEDAVTYVVEKDLFKGTSATEFSPNAPMTRGMLVTVLYRLENAPEANGTEVFQDVADGLYYTEAVAWAVENAIMNGYSDGAFGPDDPITREQLAVMLWRYAGKPAAGGSLEDFTDGEATSPWAVGALRWAAEQGIVTGKGGGILDPQGKATRAEIAAMLQRYIQAATR